MIGTSKLILGSVALVSSTLGIYGINLYSNMPVNVKDKLQKEGLLLLDIDKQITENSSNTESYKRWKELIENDSDNSKVKTFADWNSNDSQDHQKIEKIRKKCKDISEIAYKTDSFESSLEKAREFCTQNKKHQANA